MTSTGKIARLPKHIRDQLNQRLDDGQSAEDILRWLNRLPACKRMLAEKFDSRPITRQNLSQWKQGGYQAWLRVQQAREQVQSLVEQAEDLEKDDKGKIANDGITIADRLGALVAVQLLTALQKLDEITDPDQRWQRLTEIVSQLSRLRREDHYGRRVHLAKEQWDDKRTRRQEQDKKDRKEAERGRLIAWAFSLFTTKDRIESHGGGEMGRRWADWFHRIENDLPLPKWFPGPWADTHFGPDGADWSKVQFPDEPKASSSSSVAPKSEEGGSSSNKTKAAPSHALHKSDNAARNTNHETSNSKPIPLPDTPHQPASPKPPNERSSPSSSESCKVNQSKSNRPSADVTTDGNPLTRDPQPSSPSDHAARNTEHETRNSPPPQQTPPLDTRHPNETVSESKPTATPSYGPVSRQGHRPHPSPGRP